MYYIIITYYHPTGFCAYQCHHTPACSALPIPVPQFWDHSLSLSHYPFCIIYTPLGTKFFLRALLVGFCRHDALDARRSRIPGDSLHYFYAADGTPLPFTPATHTAPILPPAALLFTRLRFRFHLVGPFPPPLPTCPTLAAAPFYVEPYHIPPPLKFPLQDDPFWEVNQFVRFLSTGNRNFLPKF